MDLQALFRMVDGLSCEDRSRLYDYLSAVLSEQPESREARIFDLHPNAIQTTDDFDADIQLLVEEHRQLPNKFSSSKNNASRVGLCI